MKKLLILLLQFIGICLISGQQSTFDFLRFNTTSGLSNNTVISILQDNKGFLWVGTDDGLNRFDGVNFKVYKPQPKNSNSLRHNIAKSIFEDSKGNLWIGTDGGGLSKYDPVYDQFTNFQHIEGDSSSLSHNNISCITEDRDGNIWIGTYGGGLNILNKGKKTFWHLRNDGLKGNSLSSDYINSLLCDSKGNIWIGTWAKGIDLFDPFSKSIKNFQNIVGNKNSLSSNTVNCIVKDNEGLIWIGTWQGGLCRYDPAINNFVQVPLIDKLGHTYSHSIIRSMSLDHAGNLWLGTYGDGLLSFSKKKNLIENVFRNEAVNQFSLINNNIWATCFTSDHILWIGTIEGGLNKLDLNKRRFRLINNITENFDPLKAEIVTSIEETKSGNLLIGTRDDGFSLVDPNFKIKETFKSNQSALVSNKINCIKEDKEGNWWIATQDGLSHYILKEKRFENFSQNAYNFLTLSINNTTQVFEDQMGEIWISTWGGGVNRFLPDKKQFEHYLANEKSRVVFKVNMTGYKVSEKGIYLVGNLNGWNPAATKMYKIDENIFGIALDLYPGRIEYKFINGNSWGNEELVPASCAENRNRVLIVSEKDIDIEPVLFGKGCAKISYSNGVNSQNHISSNHVYCIAEDYSGTLWFGTNNGLSKYDRKKNNFQNYIHDESNTNSLTDNHVSYILTDKDGNLWIGTLGGGLNFFDVKKEKFTAYTEADGLANNMVKSILEDKEGNLWISTNNGVSRFSIKNRDFVNFNGLKENSFHIGSCKKKYNGDLLFGSVNGLVTFNPDSFETSQVTDKVILTDLQIFYRSIPVGKMPDGRAILEKSIQYTDKVKLSYRDNIVTFQFANLQYSSPERNRFAYKLEGFDDEWHYTNSRSATYTNLNGGTYTFMVKTLDSSGDWSENLLKLKVVISPPFWKSWIFIVFIIILIAGGAYVWYHYRILARERRLISEKVIAENKIIQLEKEKLETEIDHKNNELASMTLHMSNKAKLLHEQIGHLELIARQSDKATQEKMSKLIAKLEYDTNMDRDWEFFEKHFDKVHQNFISNLKTLYPDLSANEIRLAAYIRMGMSTKEIAEITNKTIRGVESGRYRLRQTLNLDSNENLNDFLFKI